MDGVRSRSTTRLGHVRPYQLDEFIGLKVAYASREEPCSDEKKETRGANEKDGHICSEASQLINGEWASNGLTKTR